MITMIFGALASVAYDPIVEPFPLWRRGGKRTDNAVV
jgi:hypothetical protein